MIAKLAFITTPEAGRFIMHLQAFGTGEHFQFEIARSHLANIVADGANLLLRESCLNRVPATPTTEGAHERAGA